jgi:2'-5' RNA ligase
MKAYFDRHQSDKQATGWKQGEQGYPTPGRVAWDAWGGDAGYAYARRVVGQMDAADERESAPALTVVNEAHSGVMVAFMLPASARVRLARMAREAGLTDVPPGEYHVTLAYLGEMDAIADKREAVQTVVNYYAESMPPVVAKISGMGRFSETHREGMDAIYASVDSPQLPAFRQGLVDALVDMGVPVAMDHGFTPHVTLGYIPEEADTPNLRVRPVDVTFDRLTLAWGDEMTNVDMMTEDKVA